MTEKQGLQHLPNNSINDIKHIECYKKGSKTLGIDGFIVMLLYIISISPPLRVGLFYYVSVSVLCMAWLLITFNTRSEFYLRPNKITAAIIFSFVSMTVMMLLFSNIVYWKLEVGLFMYYVFVMIFLYYHKYLKAKLFRFFWIILTILPIWSFITLLALLQNPYAARSVREGNVDTTLNLAGVGGYGHIYMSAIIDVCCIVVLLEAKHIKSWKRMLLFVNAFMGFAQVFFSGYTLSAIIVLIALGSTIFFKKNKRGRPKILGILTIIILVTIILINIYPLSLYLSELSERTSHHYKVRDFIYFLDTGEFGNTFIGRFNLYIQSIKSAIRYWYGGIITIPNLQLSTDLYGWHSTILDSYAMFGIVIGTLNAYILFSVPFKLSRSNKYKFSSLPISILIGLILLLTLNNATGTIAIAITVVLYCSTEYLCIER